MTCARRYRRGSLLLSSSVLLSASTVCGVQIRRLVESRNGLFFVLSAYNVTSHGVAEPDVFLKSNLGGLKDLLCENWLPTGEFKLNQLVQGIVYTALGGIKAERCCDSCSLCAGDF